MRSIQAIFDHPKSFRLVSASRSSICKAQSSGFDSNVSCLPDRVSRREDSLKRLSTVLRLPQHLSILSAFFRQMHRTRSRSNPSLKARFSTDSHISHILSDPVDVRCPYGIERNDVLPYGRRKVHDRSEQNRVE